MLSRLLRRLNGFSARHPLLWILSLAALALVWVLTRPDKFGEDGGAPLACAVSYVADGDTMELLCDGAKQRVRLHCIDAPELDQSPWGRASRNHLRSITPRRVILIPKPAKHGYRDRFGRTVGEVLVPGEDPLSLNIAQVRTGNAAVYSRFCDEDRYYRTEEIARSARSGIWARSGAHQTPWRYRR